MCHAIVAATVAAAWFNPACPRLILRKIIAKHNELCTLCCCQPTSIVLPRNLMFLLLIAHTTQDNYMPTEKRRKLNSKKASTAVPASAASSSSLAVGSGAPDQPVRLGTLMVHGLAQLVRFYEF